MGSGLGRFRSRSRRDGGGFGAGACLTEPCAGVCGSGAFAFSGADVVVGTEGCDSDREGRFCAAPAGGVAERIVTARWLLLAERLLGPAGILAGGIDLPQLHQDRVGVHLLDLLAVPFLLDEQRGEDLVLLEIELEIGVGGAEVLVLAEEVDARAVRDRAHLHRELPGQAAVSLGPRDDASRVEFRLTMAPTPTPRATSARAPQVEPRARKLRRGGGVGTCPRRGRLGRLGGGERTLTGGTVGERMVEWGRDCEPGTLPRHPGDPGPARVGREQLAHQHGEVGGLEPGGVNHVVERVGHLRAGLEALVPVARQRPQDDAVELGGTVGIVQRGRRHLAHAHPFDRLQVVFALEQPPPGEHLVQHDAGGKDVDPPVDVVALGLLGRHVRELALQGTPLRVPLLDLRFAAERLGDAEVEQLDRPLVGQHHVGRGDVAVDHPQQLAVVPGEIVGVGEGPAHLAADVGHQLGAGGSDPGPDRAHGLGQVAPPHVLHRDEVLLVHRAQLEDLDDVRVVEARGELGLLDEHPRELGIVRQVRQDALHHEHALETGRTLDPSLEDVGHSTAADPLEQRVLAELNRLRKHYPHGA